MIVREAEPTAAAPRRPAPVAARGGSSRRNVPATTSLLLLVVYQCLLWAPLLVSWQRSGVIATGIVGATLLIGAIGWIRLMIRSRRHGNWIPIATALPALLGAFQLGSGVAVVAEETLRSSAHWLAAAGLAASITVDFAESSSRRLFLKVAAGVGSVLVLWSWIQALTSGGEILWLIPTPVDRAFGPLTNRNHFAVLCELLFPLIWFTTRQTRFRWLPLLPLAAGLTTGSRAGVVLLLAEALILYPLKRSPITRRAWKNAAMGATALAAVLAFCIWLEWDWLVHRWSEPFLYRESIWRSAIELWRERPWLGHGLGSFSWTYPSQATFDTGEIVDHAHNDWLEWGADGGIAMLVMMTLLGVTAARQVRVSRWMLGSVAVLVHCLVDYPLQKYALLVLWVVFVSIGCRDKPPQEGGVRGLTLPTKELYNSLPCP